FFNRDDVGEQTISITKEELGITQNIPYRIKDLWTQKELGYLDQQIQFSIPSHGVRLIALIPEKTVGTISQEEPISSIRIIPQPSNDIAYCSFHSTLQGPAIIEFIDMNGRIIGESINAEIRTGMQAFSLQLPQNIATGLYRLKITAGFSTVFHPILIVH
ncbi:MAG: hypothetical protein ACKO2H_02510, partial [Bacteroidota bacterium]